MYKKDHYKLIVHSRYLYTDINKNICYDCRLLLNFYCTIPFIIIIILYVDGNAYRNI